MAQVAQRIEAQLVPFAAELERLCTIPGVKQVAALLFLAEIGAEMSWFQHRPIWTAGRMAPGNNQSGGKPPRRQSPQGQSAGYSW